MNFYTEAERVVAMLELWTVLKKRLYL